MFFKTFHRAFTMIELIFVIVVLGILAGVALPKFFGSIEDAQITKAKSQVATIRAGLKNYRSKNLLQGGGGSYPSSLEADPTQNRLFDVVSEGVASGTQNGMWSRDENNNKRYYFHLDGSRTITFDYDQSKGTFACTAPSDLCSHFD